MYLYHATFRANLPSIKKLGLGAKQIKNWDFSIDNIVCFTNDAECAYSFCESADDVSDSKYESGIVVLAVNINDLNKKLLSYDPNMEGGNNKDTFAYRGVINSSKLGVITYEKGFVGKLLDLKRVPAYE